MRRQCLRILMVLLGFAGLGVTAEAQVLGQVVVTIPFAFVVAGTTLPAGQYKVNSVSDTSAGIILSNLENRASAMVIPTQVESASTDRIQMSFEEVGDQHFLRKIETGDWAFTIPVSRAQLLEASPKSHTGTAASRRSVGSN